MFKIDKSGTDIDLIYQNHNSALYPMLDDILTLPLELSTIMLLVDNLFWPKESRLKVRRRVF